MITATVRPQVMKTGLRPRPSRLRVTTDIESLARQIDLALSCPRMKFYNFFMHVPHAGRIRFLLGQSKELQQLPMTFRRTRLTLDYSVDVASMRDEHRQFVELIGPFFSQKIEAIGKQRPHSRLASLAWRWICPKCKDTTDLLLARIGQNFTCLNCHGRGGVLCTSGNVYALANGGPPMKLTKEDRQRARARFNDLLNVPDDDAHELATVLTVEALALARKKAKEDSTRSGLNPNDSRQHFHDSENAKVDRHRRSKAKVETDRR